MTELDCACACHCGPYYPCDYPGGCGDLHAAIAVFDTERAAGCRRRDRCPDRITHWGPDGEDLGDSGAAPTAPGGICVACTRDVGVAIRSLNEDYKVAHRMLGRLGRSPSDWSPRVTGSPSVGAPISLYLLGLATDLVEQATRWATVLADTTYVPDPAVPLAAARRATRVLCARAGRDLAALPLPARLALIRQVRSEISTWRATNRFEHLGREAVRLDRAMRLLSGAVPQLLALGMQLVMSRAEGGMRITKPDGVDAALGLLRVHQLIERACGRAELVHHLDQNCSNCGWPALIRRDGESYVRCTHCHDRVEEDHYDFLARVGVHQPDTGPPHPSP